jgi:biopolymer transport protein ExbD
MSAMHSTLRLGFVLMLVAQVALSQEGAGSRPAAGFKLPSTDQGAAFGEEDPILVSVVRGPEGAESRPAQRLEAWQILLGEEAFALDDAGTARLQARLDRMANVRRDVKLPTSERALLIKADAGAPYGVLQKILEAAAAAKISKVSMGVEAPDGGGQRAIGTPLPTDAGLAESRRAKSGLTPVAEVRVLLAWNRAAGKVERIFSPAKVVPPTAEGDRELEKLIRAARENLEKAGERDIPLVIDSGPGVPWQNIVDVLSAARRAGVTRVEYGASRK